MEEIIVLVNFNEYQGGGETLFVRYSVFLQNQNIKFLALCKRNSFILKELKKRGIKNNNIGIVDMNCNFYYLNKTNRIRLIDTLKSKIEDTCVVRLVTFCMRDLYTGFELSTHFENCSISHLILHIQDDLYLGQTLFDKMVYKLFNIRIFSSRYNINFNRNLLTIVNQNLGLISMAEIINNYWHQNFKIDIPENYIVPLPSFVEMKENIFRTFNNKKIIWIGRLVDFKIPSIISMIEFVSCNTEYSLTIVGDGNKKPLFDYLKKISMDITRVNFAGEVPYHELGEIIKNHSIGYGMGTSLIELAKYRIPVVIALASYSHKYFDRQICGGLFYDKSKGCDGSDLILKKSGNFIPKIKDVVSEIENDYQKAANNCYYFAKENYSEDVNFQMYNKLITKSKFVSKSSKKNIIKHPSFIRKYFFDILNDK